MEIKKKWFLVAILIIGHIIMSRKLENSKSVLGIIF